MLLNLSECLLECILLYMSLLLSFRSCHRLQYMHSNQSNKRIALFRPLSLKCSTFPNDRSVSLLALDLLLDLFLRLLLRFVPTRSSKLGPLF